MRLRLSILACVVAFAATGVLADTLVVLNKSDHEAALVDPATLEIVAKLPTGKGPHEVGVSPDGKTAYVANYGSFSVFREGERPRMEPGNTITVLDLEGRSVRGTWDLGEHTSPHGLVVSKDGKRLWVTCEGARALLEIDTADGSIAKAWKTDQEVSHMVVATPDEKKLYVANIGSGSITVIDRAADTVKNVATDNGAEGIDVSPDGREVWVANRGADNISVVDVSSDEIVATVDSGGKMPIRVEFTPDGKLVLVSNARSNSVTVFRADDRTLAGTIEVGAVPVGIQMTPDGKHAYVANTNANQVTVLDIAERKVLRSFEPGNEPDGMAWAR